MKVAIVILNWNGKPYLEKFLPSVIKHSPSCEVIVADNGSTDDSVSFIEKIFPGIRVIENKENSGFAGGYNIALKQIEAEYYVLLNSDVEVTENWIDPVIKLFEKDKTIAAAQPKIKSFNKKSEFEYAGGAGGFIDKFGYPFCRGRIFETLEIDTGQYEDEKEIFWATGACLFIRADLFHREGGFDPDFFAHMEEIDLCWRLKNSGYKIFYCPDSIVYHIGGGTLHKSNPKKTFLNFRNSLWLLLKNLPSERLLPVIFTRMILDGVAGISFLLKGKTADCFSIIKAHFNMYFNLFSVLKKRGGKQEKTLTGIYQKSLVWEYFVNGKKVFSKLNEW